MVSGGYSCNYIRSVTVSWPVSKDQENRDQKNQDQNLGSDDHFSSKHVVCANLRFTCHII